MRAWRADKGFSLVELVAVVAVLVILVAVAAPSFRRAMDVYRLQSSANMIAAEMEAARVLAVSRGARYRLDFDQVNNTVRVIDVQDPSNPPRALKQLERGVSVTPPGSQIIFFPRGHASGAETVRVSNTEGALQVAVLMSGKVTVGTAVTQVTSQSVSTTETPTDTSTGITTDTDSGAASSVEY